MIDSKIVARPGPRNPGPGAQAWRIVGLIASAMLAVACAAPESMEQKPAAQVLFVCEHGNVKSLMAASYFNQLATQRGLPYRAVSRGVVPDATSAPPPILAALASDGLDVGAFRPLTVTAADVSQASRVVVIGTDLPTASAGASKLERWDNIPAASVDYPAARDSLKTRIEDLLQRLTRQPTL